MIAPPGSIIGHLVLSFVFVQSLPFPELILLLSTLSVSRTRNPPRSTNPSSIPNFIPQATSGALVFATRSRQVALQQFLATIDVGKMGEEEALVLFSKRYWGTGNLKDKEYEDVVANLGLVHHLPLVIVGSVAYMTKTAISPSIYWNIF